MSTIQENQKREERTVIYGIVAVVVIALIVIGLVAYRGHKTNVRAEAQADQLISVIEQAGYDAPDKDVIIGLLGDDGGATCRDPNAALSQATLRNMLFNGAAGPGARPSLAAGVSVQGELAIISVYCPEELEDFQKFIDDLEFDEDLADN